jgi:hypothetical protein
MGFVLVLEKHPIRMSVLINTAFWLDDFRIRVQNLYLKVLWPWDQFSLFSCWIPKKNKTWLLHTTICVFDIMFHILILKFVMLKQFSLFLICIVSINIAVYIAVNWIIMFCFFLVFSMKTMKIGLIVVWKEI